MLVRPLEPRDEVGYAAVRSVVYHSGEPVAPEEVRGRFSRPYVAEEDGEIVGVFNVLDFPTIMGAQVVRGAGIAGVAVPPHRRGGVGTRMMAACVRRMREEGYAISHLHAFREPFYRRAGYESSGVRLLVTVRADRFPKGDERLPVRQLRPEGWSELQACHEAFTRRRPGGCLRDELLWQRILNESRPHHVYAVGHRTDFWTVDTLGEVVWSTRRGYENLLGVLRGLAVNKEGLSWIEPADGPAMLRHKDRDVNAETLPPVMYRALDVPALLRTLRSPVRSEFTLAVQDEAIPENQGPWRVVAEPDRCEVERTDQAALMFTERSLVQSLLGSPSLELAMEEGWVSQNNAGMALAATSTMPHRTVFCLERY